MKPIRTFFAVLIIVLIALPLLFGMTWAVGLTRAIVSPDFISEMPNEIISETRNIMDEMVRLGKTDDPSLDEDSRAWLRAMAAVDRTPGEVLDESGITTWLEGELDQSLKKISSILRGETAPVPVELNMAPLKRALQSPAMQNWLQGVFSNLPECGEQGIAAWRRFVESPRGAHDLPPCRPGTEISDNVVALSLDRAIAGIPEQVELMEKVDIHPRGVDIVRSVSTVTFILFLIPALAILLASLLGASSKSSFFRWAGITTLIGGGLALTSAMAARNAADWSGWIPHFQFADHRFTPLESMMIDRLGRLWSVVGEHIVQPVIEVAGGVCVVGLLIFALSYAFYSRPQAQARPASPSEPPLPKENIAASPENGDQSK